MKSFASQTLIAQAIRASPLPNQTPILASCSISHRRVRHLDRGNPDVFTDECPFQAKNLRAQVRCDGTYLY